MPPSPTDLTLGNFEAPFPPFPTPPPPKIKKKNETIICLICLGWWWGDLGLWKVRRKSCESNGPSLKLFGHGKV